MSAEDISRYLFDPRMHYATVLMQQGRVLTDSDWNEMANLEDEDRRQLISETVCTEGSPNNGFKIGGPVVPFSVNIFPDNRRDHLAWSQQLRPDAGTGSLYLGGYRFTIDPATPAETFQTQVDWLTRTLGTGKLPQVPTSGDLAGPRTDIVYLMGYEQAVTSIEDQNSASALGGPDTSVRLRRMRRIAILPNMTATTCAEARAALRTQLALPRPGDTGGPHSFDPTGTELLSKARLTVTFPAAPTPILANRNGTRLHRRGKPGDPGPVHGRQRVRLGHRQHRAALSRAGRSQRSDAARRSCS
jgi:hypothetical protein